MKTDFIVIGSGLAGLTSSLILSQYGKVLLITKGKLSDGSTNWAQGGIACAVSENDSWQKHFEDTLIAGAYHNDKKAVEFLVKNAPAAIDWLSKQGVAFEKIKGKFKIGREGGHSYNRIIHATDFTGKEIELALTKRVKKNRNIKIWEYTFAEKLLVTNKECFGVQLIGSIESAEVDMTFLRTSQNRPDVPSGLKAVGVLKKYASPQTLPRSRHSLLINCFCRVVVLATGGLGQIYQWTTNPSVSSGDGFVLAHHAGAKLKDMEFIQFHPTALKHGASPLFLISEALRGEGAYLVRIKNKNRERFMGNYDKRLELAPRDIVARAIFNEQQKGYEVYLDIRHKGKKFLQKRFPNIFQELKKRGFDLSRDLIPVTPAAHFSCGGVETDLYGRTNIKNLFAFGEVACSGVHGANRLASNSLLEAVVFPLQLSKIISRKSSMIRIIEPVYPTRLNLDTEHIKALRRGPTSLINLREKLQQLMWEKVGIVRRKKDLEEAKEQLKIWEKDLKDLDSTNIELLELKNMLTASHLIIESALKCRKSLGAHFLEN